MKTLYYSLVLSASVLTSCSDSDGYRIAGTVDNKSLDGKYVYLYLYGVGEPCDSALVSGGTFKFKGNQAEPVVASLNFGSEAIETTGKLYNGFEQYEAWFLLDNSNLKVKLGENSTISGSAENNDLNSYIQQLDAIYRNDADGIIKMMDSRVDSLVSIAEAKMDDLDARAANLHREYVSHHNNSLPAAMVLYNNRYTIPEAVQRELIAASGDVVRQWQGIVKMADHLAILEKVAIGRKFTDFEMPDPKGNEHKLSEYVGVGKVVLMDFWASWCGPCRRSMPQLKEIYAQYKNKGFEIVGVSFDRTHEAWVKGIDDLGLTWPQMSDVKYWKSAAAGIYGVNSIPHTVLIDKDGTIIAKNLHGKALTDKLDELLK